jgi:hypothetical protein
MTLTRKGLSNELSSGYRARERARDGHTGKGR